MKKILLNLALAAVATALALASCTQPLDIDRDTIQGRQAIELLAEGERFEKQGDYRMALDKFEKARGLAPSPAVYYHMGACYFNLRQYPQAQEFLTTAKRMAGDYPAAEYLLSQVRIQLALAGRGGKATPGAALPTQGPVSVTPVVSTTPPSITVSPAVVGAPTPRPTPRQVAEAPSTPIRPPRTDSLTPAPVERTPLPVQTPRATPYESLSSTASNPVVTAPAPSVEIISTPRPTPRPGVGVTPVPVKPPGPLPTVPTREIFLPIKETDLSNPPAVTPKGITTGTVETSPLIGQWQFHWEQAQSYYDRKLYDEAVQELLLVKGAQPRFLDARLKLADAYDMMGRGEKALAQFEEARIFCPNEPKAYLRTGNFYLRHAKENPAYYDRARTYFFEALRVSPQYYFACHNIGVTYMEDGNGNFETARKWFERALDINPEYASAHRNLGLLCERNLNNPKLALEHYRAYVRLGGPDADEVKDWIRALEESK
jgi:tetratricopeptide (TPR) repeat protein